ncbi:MAG: hypothetical protein JO266_20580 [Acidobacteria bacterium]|nr:hypothetical protein [Acidobacteriota bacterium]
MSNAGTRKGTADQLRKVNADYPSTSLAGKVETASKRVGYGLPCANCGTYYAADQSACPICRSGERVSPRALDCTPVLPVGADLSQLDQERERFLKEYKSQLFASHTLIDPAASFGCSLDDNHDQSYEPASVCKGCYQRAQQKADLLEAALHMDVREAAQVVHDAVWADPSDPSKTYQNAAQALLTELRKRAGINMLLTTLQPYQH